MIPVKTEDFIKFAQIRLIEEGFLTKEEAHEESGEFGLHTKQAYNDLCSIFPGAITYTNKLPSAYGPEWFLKFLLEGIEGRKKPEMVKRYLSINEQMRIKEAREVFLAAKKLRATGQTKP